MKAFGGTRQAGHVAAADPRLMSFAFPSSVKWFYLLR
jgi:hypothetical protein